MLAIGLSRNFYVTCMALFGKSATHLSYTKKKIGGFTIFAEKNMTTMSVVLNIFSDIPRWDKKLRCKKAVLPAVVGAE